jgi:hypothetical protein
MLRSGLGAKHARAPFHRIQVERQNTGRGQFRKFKGAAQKISHDTLVRSSESALPLARAQGMIRGGACVR